MKIELSHDTLARKVYDKASTEDKMRLKIANFIRGRHEFFRDQKTLLNRSDLNYIEPYIDQVQLTPEQYEFYQKSRRIARRNYFLFLASGVLAFLVATSLAGIFWKQGANLQSTVDELALKQDSLELQLRTIKSQERKILGLDSLADAQGLVVQTYMLQLDSTNKALMEKEHIVDSLNKELKRQNNSLRRESSQLTAKNADLKKDVALAKKEKIAAENNEKKILHKLEQAKSIILSTKASKAQSKAINSGRESDHERAFQLAAAAYERNPDDRTAKKILIYYGENRLGKYNYRNEGDVIRILTKVKKKYAPLSSRQIERELNRAD